MDIRPLYIDGERINLLTAKYSRLTLKALNYLCINHRDKMANLNLKSS